MDDETPTLAGVFASLGMPEGLGRVLTNILAETTGQTETALLTQNESVILLAEIRDSLVSLNGHVAKAAALVDELAAFGRSLKDNPAIAGLLDGSKSPLALLMGRK